MELTSGIIKVQAELVGDRFAFTVLANCDGEWTPVLVSENGDESRGYPLSPPIQQAVLEWLPTNLAAILGVGMAGDGHWSISIAENHTGGVDLDVACRWKSPMAWLGSTWRIEQAWRMTANQEHSPALSCVDLVSGGVTKLRLKVAPPARFELADAIVAVSVPTLGSHTPPTVRWKFSLHAV